MKILMFGWEWPPFNSGGLGTACFGLVRSLAKKGAEVIFVLPKKVPVTSDFAQIVFADVPDFKSTAYSSVESAGWGLLDEVFYYAKRGGEIAKGEKFDVIHAHDWLCYGAGIEAKKVSGKPLIVHVHATEYDRTGNGQINPAVYRLEKKGMEAADKIAAVSQFTKNIIVDKYGINPDKVEVVHNGIDSSDYPSSRAVPLILKKFKEAGSKIVLFVGRLTLQKGPDYFIKTAKKVLELRPQTLFVIAGSGDMQNQIIREAAGLGRVHFNA